MARIRVCVGCRKPERECDCPPDEEPGPDGSGQDDVA